MQELLHGLDDLDVAGAAAEVAGELAADRIGREPPAAQRVDGHQEARGAEAALERVVAVERLLQRPPLEALDRAHARAVGLDGEQQAGADGNAVELNRARAADAVLA